MNNSRLDKSLIRKISAETKKPEKYIREQISKRANNKNISSETVLILWAKDLGVATKRYENKLNFEIRRELQDFLMPLKQQNHLYVISSQTQRRTTNMSITWKRVAKWILDHIIAEIFVGVIVALILFLLFGIAK